MKSTMVAAALAAIAGSVSASIDRAGHQHAHELFHVGKRGGLTHNDTATCVPGCTTYWYTSYGPAGRKETRFKWRGEGNVLEADMRAVFAVYTPPATSAPPAPTTTSVNTTSTTMAVPTTKATTTVAPPPPPPTSSAAPSSSAAASSPAAPKASSSSSSSASVSLGGGGNQWAMTYTAYADSGACKSADEVSSDMAAIKAAGFASVRFYSTDCSTLTNAASVASSIGLKVILGIFIKGQCSIDSADVSEQVSAITSWAQWTNVELVSVGNEDVANGDCQPSDLLTLIPAVQSALSAAGYNGPITHTDTVAGWQTSGMTSLCSVMGVITANIHAFFNPDTTADQAGAFVSSQLSIVESICPGLPAYVTESGWPSNGDSNGKALPGTSEQATAIASIKAAIGSKVAFFSFSNDAWKEPGSLNVEQYFGCGNLFGA
jgi:exo-beta-1,3-glucanase (GH17 family)